MHVRPVLLVALLLEPAGTLRAEPGEMPWAAEARESSLRLATSDDGQTFRPTALFSKHAANPDLVRLPDGHFLAIFDKVASDGTNLMVSRSLDNGRTWSAPREILWEGGENPARSARHASAVVTENGWLRIFFCMDGGDRSRQGCTVASAVTRDGLHYRLDPHVRLPFDDVADVAPCAGWIGGELHLFVAPTKRAAADRTAVQHFVSSDESRFQRLEPLSREAVVTQIVRLRDRSVRALAINGRDVVSYALDRSRWRAEEGVRIRGATDAAWVELDDRTFLMLYSSPMARAQTQPELARDETNRGGDGQSKDNTDSSAPSANPEKDTWKAFATTSNDVAPSDQNPMAIWPPTTDLQHPVDYLAWFRQSTGADQPENAYFLYQSLLAASDAWSLSDMLNQHSNAAIQPWDPRQHPDWEASYQAMLPVLQQFQQAAASPAHFATPAILSLDPNSVIDPQAGPALVGILLPHLSKFRSLCRATLSDAWRQENGVVPPEQVRESLRTVLNNARHCSDGATLIDHLVGIAERNMAYQHARLALAQGVFKTPAEIESALRALQECDGRDARRSHWIGFEQACFNDTMQYLFPPGGDGQPRISTDRVRKLFYGSSDMESRWTPQLQEELNTITADDARDAIVKVNAMMQQVASLWATGYPTVRTSQIGQLEDDCESSLSRARPLFSRMFPHFARAHQLETRSESSRRATQLAFHVNLYHAVNGTWPASLDQVLPSGDVVRTDPFTGQDYAYHLTAAGPRIYSLSDNGQDDGGVHSAGWADVSSKATAGGSDDYVFWPPQ